MRVKSVDSSQMRTACLTTSLQRLIAELRYSDLGIMFVMSTAYDEYASNACDFEAEDHENLLFTSRRWPFQLASKEVRT